MNPVDPHNTLCFYCPPFRSGGYGAEEKEVRQGELAWPQSCRPHHCTVTLLIYTYSVSFYK